MSNNCENAIPQKEIAQRHSPFSFKRTKSHVPARESVALSRSFERQATTTFRFKRDTKLWLVKWCSQKFVGNEYDRNSFSISTFSVQCTGGVNENRTTAYKIQFEMFLEH